MNLTDYINYNSNFVLSSNTTAIEGKNADYFVSIDFKCFDLNISLTNISSWMNYEQKDEKDRFCEQYLKIFANEKWKNVC